MSRWIRADRVAVRGQNLQQATGQALFPLYGLVGIGIHTHRDDPGDIAWPRQFPFQQLDGIVLEEQLALEIEPCRKPAPGMGWSGKAIDAAMLAAAIRVYRSVERDVRRFVEGDDGAGRILHQKGLHPAVIILNRAPAIIKGLACFELETAGLV